MFQWLRDLLAPSAEVQKALDGSQVRLSDSEEFRRRIEHSAAPLDRALAANGFAPAVLATFARREQ